MYVKASFETFCDLIHSNVKYVTCICIIKNFTTHKCNTFIMILNYCLNTNA